MSTILNTANCGQLANTGSATCNLIPRLVKYAVAVPKGFVIPAASITDAATFAAYFKGKFTADARSGRFFLSPLLTNFDPKGGDLVSETRDNYEFTVQQKPYNWGWTLNPSGQNICDYKNWYAFANLTQSLYDYLLIDDNGQVWGTAGTDTTGAQGLGGFAMAESVVEGWTPQTAAALTKYMFRLKFLTNAQVIQNFAMVAGNIFPDTTYGLIGTTLAHGATANTSTHIYVTGTMGCGGQTLGSVYGSTLAAAGAWVITDNGTPVTLSAVAYDAVNDQYNFTVGTLTTGHVIIVKLAAPSVVNATPYFANIISETGYTYTTA